MYRVVRAFFQFTGIFVLLVLSLFAGEDRDFAKPLVFSSIEDSAWLTQCVEQYPELLWLADRKVRKTEEGQPSLSESYSQQLFGEKFVEFDRTVMSIKCLKCILDGSESAYQCFTSAQPIDLKLSIQSFNNLHERGKKLLQSEWGGLNEAQIAQAMETALVLSDMGKSEKARALFKPYGVCAPDHDDFYAQAMQILNENPTLCPSFLNLSILARGLLGKTAGLAHYGHITHLEGGLEMFDNLKVIAPQDPFALFFDLFIHTCDVAGALGHVNNQSSLVYTERTHKAMQAMTDAVSMLVNPCSDELDVYNRYLSTRASWLDLDPDKSSTRVLSRIAAILRLYTPEDGKTLQKTFFELETDLQESIIAQLDVHAHPRFIRTPTYIPAVLVNLSNNLELGKTPQERLSNALTIGLPFISRALKTYEELLINGQFDPEVPLNFNKIAFFAKSDPRALIDAQIFIDAEGNIDLF